MSDQFIQEERSASTEPQMAVSTPSGTTSSAGSKTLTINLPRVNTQTLVLGLVALVTVFQTIQLYALKSQGVTVKAATQTSSETTASTSSSSSASGTSADLPSMVGGC